MSEAVVSGVVHLIEDTKTFGQKGFRKRLVVLEQDNGRFVNYIPVDFIQDGCDSVDELNLGDEIDITYRLSGRKWQKDSNSEVKFFLNAEAVRFKARSGNQNKKASAPAKAPSDDPHAALAENAESEQFDDGSVPF